MTLANTTREMPAGLSADHSQAVVDGAHSHGTGGTPQAVSYTHLTLPTNREV